MEKAEDSYPNFPKDKKGGEYQRQLQKIEQANKNILAGGDAQDGDEESRIKMSLRVLWGTDYFCIERKKFGPKKCGGALCDGAYRIFCWGELCKK
ncbi:hypothetical protein Q7Z28_00380 [Glaesserella parasuis]|uniref:hypothetical protein n=1 Tax=Glaesserella parasuis TaxID=738 RepID=UPI0003AC322C|nr:hypothetical protein [Glaesserella parasuis]ATW43309.1 hypothetical protein A2U20_05615 [Glaesserella parasuis D74]EQA10767.1 hypothetical protein HPSD74_0467 [Glaesserella parasuis D74]MDP0316648.1 hypothetical protein [Glaesserella parasuis]